MPVGRLRTSPWLAPAALAVAWLALACGGGGESIVITFASPTATAPPASPTPTPEPTPTATPTPNPNVCGVNPDPASAGALQVQEPRPGERVTNPFHVRGWGAEIGRDNSGVAVALVDAAGNPSPAKDARPESRAGRIAPPGLTITEFTAPFATDLLVSGLRSPTPFCIWVFPETTPEGRPLQVVQVPVIVEP